MGIKRKQITPKTLNTQKCQEEKEKVDTAPELVPVPLSTSLPSWSTSAPRSLSSPVTPPKTTEDKESPQDSSSSPSEMMRSSATSSPTLLLPKVVSSHTSTHLSFQRENDYDALINRFMCGYS